MKAVLEVEQQDINSNLLKIIGNLFKKDVSEIIIRKHAVRLEEFDKSLEMGEIVSSLNQSGYSITFIKEIETGLKNSSAFKP